MRSAKYLGIAAIAFVAACRREEPEPERRRVPKAPTKTQQVAEEKPEPPPEQPASGPRYLRANGQGALVDAFQFPSVPAFIVEQQVEGVSSRGEAAGVLRRFGLSALEGKTGEVWIARASLVDRQARERVLFVTFRGEAKGNELRDEQGWLVFLGSTEDDRVLKIGNAQFKARTFPDAPVDIEAREVHSRDFDDLVATWSSCERPMQKGCYTLRAWTMQRGYPEQIVDVTGDSKPSVSGLTAPYDIVVDGRVLKWDAQVFAYR